MAAHRVTVYGFIEVEAVNQVQARKAVEMMLEEPLCPGAKLHAGHVLPPMELPARRHTRGAQP